MSKLDKEKMMEAVIQFKGVWPDDATCLQVGRSGEIRTFCKCLGDHYESEQKAHILCTRQEFESFVESLFDGAPDDAEYCLQDAFGDVKYFKRSDVKIGGKTFSYTRLRCKWTLSSWDNDHMESVAIQRPRPKRNKADEATICINDSELTIDEWVNTDIKIRDEWVPEIGDECEYTTTVYQQGKPHINVGEWYYCKIIAYNDGFVWTSDNGLRMLSATRFRPLKTEVDKGREELINIIKSVVISNISVLADAIIKAGYTKQ